MLPVAAAFTAFFALMLVALSIPVTLRRVKVGDWIGDSPDRSLHRRIRAQGNFTEYVPLGLIVIGLAELRETPGWAVVALGAALAAGRLLHAVGMWRDAPALRGFGMILTYLALAGGAGMLAASVAT